jgi:hypothetical protein
MKLNIKLKDSDDIEKSTLAFIKLLQEAAQQATPPIKPRPTLNDIPLDIKGLVAKKRKARTIWHRTHAPADKNKFNQLNIRLEAKLKKIINQNFEEYVSKLTRYDNSIWKPIRNLKQPKHDAPPIRKNNAEPWAKATRRKLTYLRNIYLQFTIPLITTPIHT